MDIKMTPQRAFIIGNGPSLAQTPLDLLAGEVTYATNHIHLIFDKTIWRPTYYVRAENPWATREVVYEDLKAIFQLGIVSILNRGYEEAWRRLMPYEDKHSVVNFLPPACEHTFMHFDDSGAPREWHEPMCQFGSSVHVALQLAAKAGYRPLYLVGCDLGYKDGEPSHFAPEYETPYLLDGRSTLKPAHYANGDCLWAHNIAYRSSPASIYNATIGGELEVYPRVDIFGLFSDKESDHGEEMPTSEIRTPADDGHKGDRDQEAGRKKVWKVRGAVHGRPGDGG